ncbi:MAG: DNA-methyltransferase [Candidatus Limnocylindrales bacterium]
MITVGKDQDINLVLGDSFELIKQVSDGTLDLTVTSPPYNVGKAYERRVGLDQYLEAYKPFAHELFRATADGGSVCWQIGNYVDKGEVFPLDIFFYRIFKEAGFQLRNRIIWHFEHGLHASRRLSGRYETILWFTKTDDYTFNLDPIRVPSKYPGKRAFKGDRKGQPTGNPLGKNPSDIWQKVVEEDWERELWNIPNVKANHPEKTVHPCQFPVELVQRCVVALTDEGGIVLDPFLGVGSTAIGALMHDRRFIGFELDPDYLAEAEGRVASFRAGTLRVRPLGRPVHQPTGREKVASIPEEWIKDDSEIGVA